jgi:hypothetical protein
VLRGLLNGADEGWVLDNVPVADIELSGKVLRRWDHFLEIRAVHSLSPHSHRMYTGSLIFRRTGNLLRIETSAHPHDVYSTSVILWDRRNLPELESRLLTIEQLRAYLMRPVRTTGKEGTIPGGGWFPNTYKHPHDWYFDPAPVLIWFDMLEEKGLI